MNSQEFTVILQEGLSPVQKRKLWKRIVKLVFKGYDDLAEKTRDKKKLKKDLYDKASEKYQGKVN